MRFEEKHADEDDNVQEAQDQEGDEQKTATAESIDELGGEDDAELKMIRLIRNSEEFSLPQS